MANVYAVKSGNWSDTTVWNTGALPTSADDVYSNTFTVTIDVSPTVLSIRNSSATGITQGGGFLATNGITVTATGVGVIAGGTTTTCINSNLSSGQSFTIVANATGGSIQNSPAIANNSLGTLYVIGRCTGGSQNTTPGVIINNGIVYITGDCYASSNYGTASWGVINSGGTLYLTGNCYGSTSTGSSGYYSNGGISFLTGNVFGGTSSNSPYGAVIASGNVSIIGSIQSSNSWGGVNITGGTVTMSGPFLTSTTGINPVLALRWFWANSNVTPTYYQIRTQDLATIRPLYTADSVGGNPAVSNVRSGTVFGPNSELTGTLSMPPASSVLSGVPVDNTTGTALFSTPVDFWNHLISGITTSGSIGERLKTVATVNTTGQQISDAFSSK